LPVKSLPDQEVEPVRVTIAVRIAGGVDSGRCLPDREVRAADVEIIIEVTRNRGQQAIRTGPLCEIQLKLLAVDGDLVVFQEMSKLTSACPAARRFQLPSKIVVASVVAGGQASQIKNEVAFGEP
jgi:hypothetical protein